jgi:hypothetical protein
MTNHHADDGRDFDFLQGSWRSRQHRLVDVSDPDCDEWVDFKAEHHVWPILGGLGNLETFSAPQGLPRPIEAVALRTFDPATGVWRIWWLAAAQPGVLDAPVLGRFEGHLGEFTCEDELNGRQLSVRYRWDSSAVTWEQAFSYDGRQSWITNWRAEFLRL